mgnify:FL=1
MDSYTHPELRKEILRGQLRGMGIVVAFTALVVLAAILMGASGLKKMGTSPPLP